MDNIPSLPLSQPPNQSSTPQIRSRITVVCAECKRLKLKCDRRVPCGSCTKRDTVPRCIYSPAAAEKVDLHSLNNRLIQVEATLSLITSGQTPPVFQSSYPFSQIPSSNLPNRSPSSSSNSRHSPPRSGVQHHFQHHLAPAGTTDAFISVSPQDLSSLWLDELERNNSPPLELKLPPNSPSVLNHVKLEVAPDPELPCSSTSDIGLSRKSQSMEITAAYFHLPTPDIYYPPPHSPSGSQQQPLSYASSSSHVSPQVPFPSVEAAGKPYVTPTLVALLPPFSRAKQLLQSAAHLFSIRPIPLPACLLSSLSDESGDDGRGNRKGKGKARCSSLATQWDLFECRALCLIGSRGLGVRTTPAKSDRKEREKVGARAREIFFGSGVASASIMMDSLARHQVDLKSESAKAAVEVERDLIDLEHTTKDQGESLPFFAVVCMVLAMGTATSEGLEGGERKSQAATPIPSTGRERYETSEYFHALAQQSLDVWEKNMAYTSPPPSKETGKSETASEDERLDFLIASLLGVGYQLFKSYLKIDVKDIRHEKITDLSRLLPLVAKIVNMARIFGLGKAQKSSGKASLDEDSSDKRKGKSGGGRRRKDDLKRVIWWDIVFYELFISDALGHPSLLTTSSCAVKLPRCVGSSLPLDEADSDQDEGEENLRSDGLNDVVEAYHGARCRLTKIAQMVKHRMMYPDCCCGYTLQQAASLEREITHFLEHMPLPLRFSDDSNGDAPPSHLAGDALDKRVLRMQRCALTITAHRLTIMVYLPFLRRHPASWHSSISSVSDSYAQRGDIDRGSGNIWNPVLYPIFRAAQCIIQASLQLGSCNVSPRQILPLLLGLYPVEKSLLDAVTICTYITVFHAALIPGRQVADSAISGMRMLWSLTLGSECEALFQRLKKKFVITPDYSSAHGIKRKHEQIVIPTAGSHGVELSKNDGEPPPREQPLMTRGREIAESVSAVGARSGGTLTTGRDPETGQKEKKHAKKSYAYPSVGIRVRQGTETSSFLRPKIGSPSIPTSRVEHRQGLESRSSALMATPATEGQPPSTLISNTATSLDRGLRHRSHSLHDPPPLVSFITQFREGNDRLRTNDVARLETYDHGYQQQEVCVNPITLPRDEEHKQQRTPSYLQGVTPMTAESSPYGSSGNVTPASGSPYAASGNVVSVSGPSLGQAPQAIVSHPSASPAYGHAYYHMGSTDGFGANPYNQTQGQENVSYTGVRLDTAGEPSPSVVNGDPTGGSGMAATVPSPPVYEKTRSGMYDIKPPMDVLVQQQMHRHQMLQHQTAYDVEQHQQQSIPITESTWPPQSTVPIDSSHRFWTPPAEEFKYYS